MEPVVFVPLALIAAFVLGCPSHANRIPQVRCAVVAGLALLFVHYASWRLWTTALPADRLDIQSALIWGILTIEALAWLDAAILFSALCRQTERSSEADAHEARLRALPPGALPDIDVFIATYNEPLEVLERTIVGATWIDWPAERLNLWVLDDGSRDWLRDFCAARGIGYLTRPDNAHAKAGNINAAIPRTHARFFAIFDADFIPQRNIFYRMMGFFDDPRVGIVQVPHSFFNHDPMQANLVLRETLPGDQSLFFDRIMPGRDGWDCAFCCGSNSVTRRAAIETIGNAMPTGSITEDMLLTLALLRKGYVTRYLNERLAIGLAPESLDAFFVQRARWARGALQMLYLRDGPLGPGLRLMQRLMFLPTHWLSQALTYVASLTVPCIYLLTGLLPMVNVTTEAVVYYQLPMLVGVITALRFFAPGQYFPLPSIVLGVLQSFRFLPTLIGTLIRPHGHAFRVTPKGSDAVGRRYDPFTVVLAATLLLATAVGFVLNSNLDTRIVPDVSLVPIVALWSGLNIVVLMIVLVTAFTVPPRRGEERFEIDEPVLLRARDGALPGRMRDLSLSGVSVHLAAPHDLVRGDWLAADVAAIGEIPARVVRISGPDLGMAFHLPASPGRDRLIGKIFTAGRSNATHNDNALAVTLQMIEAIFRSQPTTTAPPPEAPPPPDWLLDQIAARARDQAAWEADTLAELWEADAAARRSEAV